MNKQILVLIVFSLVFLVQEGLARNYYVATNGNDTTGTGSITAPYASIIKAQSYVVAGDTVYVRGGTYVMKESQISYTFIVGPYACMH